MIDIDDSEIDVLDEFNDLENNNSDRKAKLKGKISEAKQARNEAEIIKGDAAISKAEADKAREEAEEAKAEAKKCKLEAEQARVEANIVKAEAKIAKAEAKEILKKYEGQERRKKTENQDRRQEATLYDDEGNVKSEAYKGPDRRSGHDRRADREELIRKEHQKFVIRSVTYSSVIGISIITISLTLFAPEVLKVREFLKSVNYKAIASSITNSGIKDFSLSATLNRYIGNVENYVEGVSEATEGIKDIEGNPTNDLAAIKGVLSNLTSMHRMSYEDKATALNAAHNLKNLVSSAILSDPSNLKETLMNATDVDKNVRNVLEQSKGKSVAAGALLFALNEFRDNIYSGSSYESDITLIKKLAGDDPEMNAAINQLLPYARSGVMSKDVLSAELKSLANDIVLAKIKGQDANVKDRALDRFEKLKQRARSKQLGAHNEEAIVARAQVMLEQGDVEGAMMELQQLKGPNSSLAANNWINNASKTVAAGNSSDLLIQQIVKQAATGTGFSPEKLIRMIKPGAIRPVYISPKF